jgi:hypothetical protein
MLSDDQELGDEYDEYDATDQKGPGHSQEIVFSQLKKRLIHSIPKNKFFLVPLSSAR